MQSYIEPFGAYLAKEKKRAANTIVSYQRDLRQFIAFLDAEGIDTTQPGRINQTNIMAHILFLERNGKTSATVSRNIATLKTFFKYLLNSGVISHDPTYQIKAPKIKRKAPHSVDLNSIELLMRQPNDSGLKGIRDRAILELLFATGIKVTELITLDLSDINLSLGYIECYSGKRRRIIPMGKKAIQALQKYITHARRDMLKDKHSNILFVNCNGAPFTRQGLWKIIKAYAKKAGISDNITPNILRHSFAMHLVSNGADMESLREMLGHSDMATTQIYFQTQTNRLREVYDKAHPRK